MENNKKTGLVHADPEQILERIEGKFELLEKIRNLAVKHTKPQDWVDQNGRPYLVESGAMEIAKAFDIAIHDTMMRNPETVKHEGEPDEIIYTITGNITIAHLGTFPGMGSCSTRDNLLGTKKGKPKPLNQISLPSIKKKTHTNFVRNVIAHALGLNNRTWEELEVIGIDRSKVTKVTYEGHGEPGKQQELSQNAELKLAEIRHFAKEVFQGDAKKAKEWYVGETEFTAKDGTFVKGKSDPSKFTEGQVNRIHPRLKKKFDAIQEGPEGEKGDPGLFEEDKSGAKTDNG